MHATLLSHPLPRRTGDEGGKRRNASRPIGQTTTDWADAPTHRAISTHDLMAGERVIIIRHGEEMSPGSPHQDKLILTK